MGGARVIRYARRMEGKIPPTPLESGLFYCGAPALWGLVLWFLLVVRW